MSSLRADDSLASVDSNTSKTTEERPDSPRHWIDIALCAGEKMIPEEDDDDDDEAYFGGAQPRDDDDYDYIDYDYGDAESRTLRSTPSHSSVASTASATSSSTVSAVGSVSSRSSSITLGRAGSWSTDHSGYRRQEVHALMNDPVYLNRSSSSILQTSIGSGSYHAPSPSPPSPPPPAYTPAYPVGYPYQGGHSRPATLGRTDSTATIATEPDDSVPDRRSPTPQPSSSAAPAQNANITYARRDVAISPRPARSTRGVEAHAPQNPPRRRTGGLTMRPSFYERQEQDKAYRRKQELEKTLNEELRKAGIDLESVSKPRNRQVPRIYQAGGHGSFVRSEPQYRE
ncbi:hypothetical protein K525DRAFT_269322 [Schizophyllum commune Loenen D]|nr:hypothetical protein K525DRAFT_269322 [Schizophyllum commune Loenen D]